MAVIVLYPMRETNFSAPIDYIMYKGENAFERDQYGLRIYREEFSITYMNSHGEIQPIQKWEADIVRTNIKYGRPRGNDGITIYQYVLSFEPEDNISLSRAEYLGVKFASIYLKGHQRLIGTHVKHNKDGERLVHCHIYINAVRDVTVEIDARWMARNEKDEVKQNQYLAGLKHDPNKRWRAFLQKELAQFCVENGLTHRPDHRARDRVTYKERLIEKEGKVSHRRQIKKGVVQISKISASTEQYVHKLSGINIECEFREEYPYYKVVGSKRWISGRSLGTDYYWERISARIQANAIKEALNTATNKFEAEVGDTLEEALVTARKYIQLIIECEDLQQEQEDELKKEKEKIDNAIRVINKYRIITYEEFRREIERSLDMRIILSSIKAIIEKVKNLIKYIAGIDAIYEPDSKLGKGGNKTTIKSTANDRDERR